MPKYLHRRNIKFKNSISKLDKKRILGVAIDTSKTFHRAIIFNFDGRRIGKGLSFNSLKDGYEDLKSRIGKAQKVTKAVRTYIALESPAKYLANLVYHLKRDFKSVVFVPPLAVAENRRQRTFRALKTDDTDAGAVGDLLIRGEFIEPREDSDVYLKLRNLVYWREQKLIMRSMIKNQLNHRFERIFPGINCDFDGKKRLFGHAYDSFLHRGLLKYKKTAQEIIDIPDKELVEYFGYADHPKGPHHVKRLKSRFNEMLLPEEKTTKMELEFLEKDLELLHVFDGNIEQVEAEIVELGGQTNAKYLFNQITGISDLAASLYVGIIGDTEKYHSAGQIYSYAGLNPRRHQSGKTNKESMGIKRVGNSLLRCLLFRMASQTILCNKYFNAYYKKIRQEKKKSWKEGTIIICHKLNNIFFALMRDKVPYNDPHTATGTSS
jgi:transposase